MQDVPDRREELASTLTHGVGALASVAGAVALLVMAFLTGDGWRIVSTAVFGATMILLYTASTLYHAARSQRLRARLRTFDHCAIYLLIAGTYTPFALVGLRGGWGWSLFGVAWGLAVAGILFKLLFIGRFPRLSTAIYVGMGWMVVVAAGPLVRSLNSVVLLWLVAGGLVYTAGTLFYHSRRVPYAHAIWHLFVVVGTACHAIAVGLLI